MLLTNEEIEEISLSAVTVKDAVADVRSIETAILAKLGRLIGRVAGVVALVCVGVYVVVNL